MATRDKRTYMRACAWQAEVFIRKLWSVDDRLEIYALVIRGKYDTTIEVKSTTLDCCTYQLISTNSMRISGACALACDVIHPGEILGSLDVFIDSLV